MHKRTWILTPIVLVVVAAGSYFVYRWLTPPPLPAGILYGNGRIEGTEVIVASEVSARVLESRLVEGSLVKEGDLLVLLDEVDIKTELERVRAERAAAVRERERLQSELRTAQHHLETAQTDYARYATLRNEGTIAAARLDQAANEREEARGRVDTLRSAIDQAAEKVQSLQNSVLLAESQLGRTMVTAPLTGTVLTKSIEVGELATPGRPVATLVDLGRLEIKIYVPESEIGKLQLGNEARVRTDAFPDQYAPARVSRIDSQAQFTPRDIHMPDERVRLVFGVVLSLENAERRLKPGMPADAWVKWDAAEPWPAQLLVPR